MEMESLGGDLQIHHHHQRHSTTFHSPVRRFSHRYGRGPRLHSLFSSSALLELFLKLSDFPTSTYHRTVSSSSILKTRFIAVSLFLP